MTLGHRVVQAGAYVRGVAGPGICARTQQQPNRLGVARVTGQHEGGGAVSEAALVHRETGEALEGGYQLPMALAEGWGGGGGEVIKGDGRGGTRPLRALWHMRQVSGRPPWQEGTPAAWKMPVAWVLFVRFSSPPDSGA